MVYFEWKVNALEQLRFAPTLKSLDNVCKNLSLQKDKMAQDIQKKAARFATLPTVPQFIDLLTKNLKPRVDRVRELNADSWQAYEDCRNYILMALLFGVPPQRKQFLDLMTIDQITYHDKHTILKVLDHKTARRYGPVTVALPPYYYEDFQLYLDIRSDFARIANTSLFVKANGARDEYLTRHFQQMTQAKFGADVSIRDCRTIFINYAKTHLDLKQMYELSRQMCHSFQMQQSEYRTDDSVERAISTLHSMHEVTRLLPICSADKQLFQEEDEFPDLPSDEAFLQFIDDYNAANEEAI